MEKTWTIRRSSRRSWNTCFYGNNFKNSLINNTIFHLLNFEKHANFQQAPREAAINNDFQVVLLSEDFNPIFAIETRHQTTINEAIRRGKEAALNLSNIYSLIEIDGVPRPTGAWYTSITKNTIVHCR